MNDPLRASNDALRFALRRAAIKQRLARKQWEQSKDGLFLPTDLAGTPTEHYHVVFHVPRENLTFPNFSERFSDAQDAYRKIYEYGREAEPQTEWYEDGTVGLEMRASGRSGLWWIILEVVACLMRACSDDRRN